MCCKEDFHQSKPGPNMCIKYNTHHKYKSISRLYNNKLKNAKSLTRTFIYCKLIKPQDGVYFCFVLFFSLNKILNYLN